MEKVFTSEERRQIDELLKKHRPKPGEEKAEGQKETTVMSEKGTKIIVKSEVAGPSTKPFKERTPEKFEEASRREYELIGTDIETEYEEIDTAEEERQVAELNKDEAELFEQYKGFYTIQGRTKGKIPGFWYIHRLKVKDRYLGIPTDVAEMLSHPQEGEKQDIEWITEEKIIEIEKCHAVVPRRRVNIRPGKKTVVLCIDPDSDSDIIIEEGEADLKSRCLIVKREKEKEDEGVQADDEQSELSQNKSEYRTESKTR